MAVWRKDARKWGLEHGSALSTRLSDVSDLHRYTSPPPLSSPTATTKHAVTVCACIYVRYKQLTHNLHVNHLLNFLFLIFFSSLCFMFNIFKTCYCSSLYTHTHTLSLSLKNTPYIYILHTAMPYSLCTTYTEHVHIYHTTIHTCLSQKMTACANSEHRTHSCFSIPHEPLVLCNSGTLLSNNSLTFQSHWLLPCYSLPL